MSLSYTPFIGFAVAKFFPISLWSCEIPLNVCMIRIRVAGINVFTKVVPVLTHRLTGINDPCNFPLTELINCGPVCYMGGR